MHVVTESIKYDILASTIPSSADSKSSIHKGTRSMGAKSVFFFIEHSRGVVKEEFWTEISDVHKIFERSLGEKIVL